MKIEGDWGSSRRAPGQRPPRLRWGQYSGFILACEPPSCLTRRYRPQQREIYGGASPRGITISAQTPRPPSGPRTATRSCPVRSRSPGHRPRIWWQFDAPQRLVRPGAGLDHSSLPHPQGRSTSPPGSPATRSIMTGSRSSSRAGSPRAAAWSWPSLSSVSGTASPQSPVPSGSAASNSRPRPTALAGRTHRRPVDVPAGARWVRIGWGCPVSTSTQYACADDLLLSVITDSEPGAGGGGGSYRPLLQVAM